MLRYIIRIIKNCGLAVILLSVSSFSFAQTKTIKPLLSGIYSYKLRDVLIPREEWHPFPTADEREPWISLPEKTKRAHIIRGEAAMNKKLPAIPATLYLEWYRKEVQESNWHKVHGPRRKILSDLVIAECIEGKGRFMDAIINTVWAICEESAWYHPAHVGGVGTDRSGEGSVLPLKNSPTIALRSARTAGLLSWTIYLLGSRLDKVSPVIRRRVQQELQHRTLNPFLNRYFWWMFADFNWNTYCTYNSLPAILIMEKDKTRRIDMIYKTLRILDNYIIPQPPDGSCTEGPSYWTIAGGALFNSLELLYSATNGSIDIYDEPLIKNIGRFIYRVHINDDYYVNISDCDQRLNIPGDMVYRYGQRIKDSKLSDFGAYAAARQYSEEPCINGIDFHELRALFNMSKWLSTDTPAPLVRDVWLGDEELQMMTARSEEGSKKGLYAAAWGGHNGQHHNHNDVGNVIVFVDGNPFIIDIGRQGYTNKTFGPDRYKKWSMQSAFHNLPTVNGIMQGGGREFKAANVNYKSNNSYAQLTMDIAAAYPPEAQLDSWVRTVRLNRNKNIEISDSYSLKNKVSKITLSLMTPCTVTEKEKGILELENNGVTALLRYNSDKLTPVVENINIKDELLTPMWGSRIYRILFHTENPPLKDKWKLNISQ